MITIDIYNYILTLPCTTASTYGDFFFNLNDAARPIVYLGLQKQIFLIRLFLIAFGIKELPFK
jgi:hypothetical protein